MQSTKRPSRRRGRHTPFGATISELLRERDAPRIKRYKRQRKQDTRALCNPILSKVLTEDALLPLKHGRFEDAVRERRASTKKGPCKRVERPPVTWLEDARRESSELVRRSMAFVLIILEELHIYGDYAGNACHSALWLGKQRRKLGGEWVYVPGAEQEGLAARLGCDVRTLERTIAVLVEGRVLKAWQPPQSEIDKLPPHMRGENYPYQVYRLVGGIPDCLAANLRRWDEKARQHAGKPKQKRGKVSASSVQGGDASGSDFAQAVADAMAEETLAALERVKALREAPS